MKMNIEETISNGVTQSVTIHGKNGQAFDIVEAADGSFGIIAHPGFHFTIVPIGTGSLIVKVEL